MKNQIFLRHIAGFTVGGLLFYGIIPFCFYMISRLLVIQSLILPDQWWIEVICVILALVGIFFAIASNITLVLIGKGGPTEGMGVAISPKTKHLVTIGVYRYTRNPMVFGTFMNYFAFALYLKSGGLVILLFLLLPFFLLYLKKSEEKRMLNDFGEEYKEYQKRVSFLIPWRSFK